jgi:hypothetical protein
MKQYGLPYKINSTVTDVEDGRVVEWQHPLGHRWRWEMVETAPGTTEVTETFDYSTAKVKAVITLLGQDKQNAAGITSTLSRLAKRFDT